MVNMPNRQRQLRAASAGRLAAGMLDAPGKFQDAAQTFSLYTISLWLVPDTLLAAVSSNASK